MMFTKSFNEGYEVRKVFLDMLKGFDKVWHEVIIFKTKQNGISGNCLRFCVEKIAYRYYT